MASIIALFSGGTTGARDGTLISRDDNESAPYAFAALNTSYTLHYRVIDDTTLDDPAQDTNNSFTITAPTGVEVSANNSVWGSTATVLAATGGNKPVYVRQTARQTSAEADLEVGTGGVTFTTGTRVAQVGTITLTEVDGVLEIAADCADVASADGYEWDISTSNTFATYTRSTTVASAKTFTGLANNTTYYVRCRAFDERGVGAHSATANATVTRTLYAQTFSGVTDGASVIGYDGWTEVSNATAGADCKAATISGTKMVELDEAWTSGTAVTGMYRDMGAVALSSDVTQTFQFYATQQAVGVGFYQTAPTTGAFITIQCNPTSVKVYNGSAYVDVVTGLSSGALHTVSVTFGQGDTTCTVNVDGTDYTGKPTRATVPSTLGSILPSSANAANQANGYIGQFLLERVG